MAELFVSAKIAQFWKEPEGIPDNDSASSSTELLEQY